MRRIARLRLTRPSPASAERRCQTTLLPLRCAIRAAGKSGESFIHHPWAVAQICAELKLDSATITAALPDGILNLAVAAGLAASNSEARKLIANNGLKLNDLAVSDPKLLVDASALNSDGVLKLSSGKKKHVLVKPA